MHLRLVRLSWTRAAIACACLFLGLTSVGMAADVTVSFSAAANQTLTPTINDGQYGSNDISGLVIDIFAGDQSGAVTGTNLTFTDVDPGNYPSGVTGDFNNGDYSLVIKRSSGVASFAFKGITIGDFLGSGLPLKITGYRSGSSTGSVNVNISMVTYTTTLTPAQLTSSIFNDVDEVRITHQSDPNTRIFASINDFVIGDAVVADSTPPTVSSVSSSTANDTYKIGDTISIQVTFSENVNVTGFPQLALNNGGTATYASGTGTSVLTFSYTVASGQDTADLDYAATNSLTLSGGTLRDAASNNATLTLPTVGGGSSLGGQKNIVIDATVPTVSSVSVPTNGTYGSGQNLDFTVNTSEAVVVNTGGGTPYVALTLDTGGSVQAAYASGSGTTSLIFRYTIATGNADSTGVTVASSITANGATLRDGAGNNLTLTLNSVGSTSSVLVDAVGPTVSRVTSSTANGTYKAGDVISIQVEFNEAVTVTGTPQLTLNTSTTINYASGSGTTSLTFTYTVASGHTTSDLDYAATSSLSLNGGTLRDASNNDATLTLPTPGTANSLGSEKNLVIDGVAPTITSVAVPSNGTYSAGQNLQFTINVSEAVTVALGGGTPRISLSLDTGGTVYAVYSSGSGTSALVFVYTIAAGDNDSNGVSVGTLSANGGTLRDSAGNDLVTTLNSVGSTSNVLVDAIPPTVTGVTSSTTNGSYKSGDPISIQVTFSETVFVSGTPQLALNSGGTANYSSGSGTVTLTFSYTVASGDSSADLDYSTTSALTLNGGTLRDAALNDATLTLPTAGGGSSLGGQKNLVVDGVAPTVSSVAVPANGVYGVSQNLDFTVNLSEAATVVTGGGTPYLSLTLDTGGSVQAAYVSGSGTSSLLFRYVVSPGNADANGITVGSGIMLNGGTITDAVGNNLTTTLNSVGSTASVLIDTLPPAAPVFASISPDTGSSASDFITTATGLTFNGTAEASSTVTLTRVGVGVIGTATANGSGVWSFDYTGTTLAVGDHSFTATATDAAGNVSVPSSTLLATVDTGAPAAAAIAGISSDTGASTTDAVTNDATLVISGTAEANGTVTVYRSGAGAIGTAAVNGSGNWSFDYTATTLPDGTYLFTVTTTDLAGNTSVISGDFPVTIDTTAPAAPGFTGVSTDTGTSATDAVTTDTTLVLSGTAEAGSSVTITRTGVGSIGSVTANGAGVWTLDYTGTSLPVGTHVFTAAVNDSAGNGSTTSSGYSVNVLSSVAITSAATSTGTYGSTFSFTVTASGVPTAFAAAGLPTGLSIDPSTGAISGTPTQVGAFTVSLTASHAAASATSNLTLTIGQRTQTITFPAIANKVFGDVPIALGASSSVGNAISYAVVSGPATVSGGTLLLIGAGDVTVRASQEGDANTLPATPVDRSFVVGKATAAVSLSGLAQVYTGTARSAAATTIPAGLSVILTYNGSATAPTVAGSYPVVATVSDANYAGATTGTLVVAKATQTITFGSVGNRFVGQPISLSAVASSGLPVTYALVSGPATLNGDTLTLVSDGTVVVRASQAGDANYQSATADLTVAGAQKLAQTISMMSVSDKLTTDAPFALSGTASSGLPVSFTVLSGPALLSGNTVTLTGAPGEIVLRATQAGDAVYEAAPEVIFTVQVRPVGPLIYFGQISGSGVPAPKDMAAFVKQDLSSGVMLGTLPGLNEAFIVRFTPSADGTWTTETETLGQREAVATLKEAKDVRMPWLGIALLTDAASGSGQSTLRATRRVFRGRVQGQVLTGSVDGLGINFSTTLTPPTGPTATIAGFYESPSLQTADGGVYSIVGTTTEVYTLALLTDYAAGGRGTAQPDRTFTVALDNATALTGSIDPTSTAISGSLVRPAQPVQTFAGLAATTLRTDRLINLSSRNQLGSGARTLITGFVVAGPQPKTVLIRGVGPALSGFGLSNAARNPKLALYQNSQLLQENDDWSQSPQASAIASATARVGAFGLSPTGKDAAILVTLAPGAYTAHVSDLEGTGIGLAEIYDASENPQADYQRLTNISARGEANTGEGLLIGGFIVTGNYPKRVLVRAIGPSLSSYGVSGVAADPVLTVYSGTTVVARNDNWETPTPLNATQMAATSSELSEATRVTGAFALAAGSRDAALIVTLAPGAYTAQVSPGTASPGVALIEVYEIPE